MRTKFFLTTLFLTHIVTFQGLYGAALPFVSSADRAVKGGSSAVLKTAPVKSDRSVALQANPLRGSLPKTAKMVPVKESLLVASRIVAVKENPSMAAKTAPVKEVPLEVSKTVPLKESLLVASKITPVEENLLIAPASPFLPDTHTVMHSRQEPQIEKVRHFEIAGRFAWFLPQSKRIQNVYGDEGYPQYQLEGSVALFRVQKCVPCNYEPVCQAKWIGWANWSIYHKSGHSTCVHNRSNMLNQAVNFGVKYYFFRMRSYRPYLGLGAGFAYVRFHDHSKAVRKHVNEWGPAILVKSGIECDITCNFYADVFADYSSNWFGSPHSKHCVKTHGVNTGGGSFGLGLGYRY